MPRYLPDRGRPAERVRADDELHMPDGEWIRVYRRVDLPHAIKFVLVTGREFFAEYDQQVRSRCTPGREELT